MEITRGDKTVFLIPVLISSHKVKKKKKILFSLCARFKMSRLSELIWADWIWFPEGHGWADLTDHDDKVFPKTRDLWATIPVALCFLVIRQIFER